MNLMHYFKEERYIPRLKRTANLYIGLPEDYETSSRRYPVLYMHDGHNLFFKEDSYAGHIWDVAGAFERHPDLPSCIVVALACADKGNRRIEEYNIFDSVLPRLLNQPAHGRGRTYLRYLIEQLKPEIDAEFRTLKDANHTLIMGSSMGGVISLEAGLLFPEIYGRIGCVSSAFHVSEQKVLELIDRSNPDALCRLYMDVGDHESRGKENRQYLASNHRVYQALAKRIHPEKIRYKVIKWGEHNERAWKKRLPNILAYLLEGL